MKEKSLKRNYLYNVIYKVANVIIPFITAPYIARVLGADGVGKVSYTESVVSYFVLFATMGIPIFGQREISYVQDKTEERSIVFWNTFVLQFVISLIISLVYFAFSYIWGGNLYYIFALNIFAVMFDISWFFQGIEEFGKLVLRSILVRIVNVIFLFCFVKTKNDLTIYAVGIALFPLLGNLSLWKYLRRYINRPTIKNLNPFGNIKTVLSLFIPTIAIQIYTVFDKTMIGLITKNDFQNGYYEQATKITKIVISMITAMGAVMIPRVGYYLKNKSNKDVINLIKKGYNFIWFLGIPVFIGMIVVAPNFVPWFFGDGYNEVVILLQILSALVLAICISNMTGYQYLIPTNQQSFLTVSVVVGSIVNFALNLLLINKYQAVGASIASVIAEMAVTICQMYLIRNQLPVWDILKLSKNYCIAGAIMGLITAIISTRIKASIIGTVILVVCGAAIYFLTLFVMKDSFFVNHIRQVYCKVKKQSGND